MNVASVKVELRVGKSALYFAHEGRIQFENNVLDPMDTLTASGSNTGTFDKQRRIRRDRGSVLSCVNLKKLWRP